jgi:hypothetical protein
LGVGFTGKNHETYALASTQKPQRVVAAAASCS